MPTLRIKEIMREKGFNTQKELADRMGISNANLSSILKRTPSLDTLDRIADALQVDITDLFAQKEQSGVGGGGGELTTTDFRCPHCGETLYICRRKDDGSKE